MDDESEHSCTIFTCYITGQPGKYWLGYLILWGSDFQIHEIIVVIIFSSLLRAVIASSPKTVFNSLYMVLVV